MPTTTMDDLEQRTVWVRCTRRLSLHSGQVLARGHICETMPCYDSDGTRRYLTAFGDLLPASAVEEVTG